MSTINFTGALECENTTTRFVLLRDGWVQPGRGFRTFDEAANSAASTAAYYPDEIQSVAVETVTVSFKTGPC